MTATVTRRPPGPRGHWLTGSLAEIRRDMPGVLRRTARDYGGVSRLRVGPATMYLVADGALIIDLLTRRANQLRKSSRTRWGLSGHLGNGLVTSPAQSPFPGYLIAQSLPGGRLVAAALLVTAAAVIGFLLLRRPPHTAATAALFCGFGLLTAILLMPTTRFGYLLYPAAFLLWVDALSNHTATGAPRGDAALYRH